MSAKASQTSNNYQQSDIKTFCLLKLTGYAYLISQVCKSYSVSEWGSVFFESKDAGAESVKCYMHLPKFDNTESCRPQKSDQWQKSQKLNEKVKLRFVCILTDTAI